MRTIISCFKASTLLRLIWILFTATCLEWLATLPSCSATYLFKFGQNHSNILYLCSPHLDQCRPASQKGVAAGLAGVCSRWGLPPQLRDSKIRQECMFQLERFQKREEELKEIENFLNRSLFSKKNFDGERNLPPYFNGAVQFLDEFARNAHSKEKRVEFLKYWSGFDEKSWNILQEWSLTGVFTHNTQRLSFSQNKDLDEWEDRLPPRKADFEISYQVEFLPSSRAAIGIARLKTIVKSKFVCGPVTPILVCENISLDQERVFNLKAREKFMSTILYEPVVVPYPCVGQFSDSVVVMKVRLE